MSTVELDALWPDDGIEGDDLPALRRCAAAWEPDARLLGNVRASTIVALCDELTESRRVLGPKQNCGCYAVDGVPVFHVGVGLKMHCRRHGRAHDDATEAYTEWREAQ